MTKNTFLVAAQSLLNGVGHIMILTRLVFIQDTMITVLVTTLDNLKQSS